MDHVYGVVCVVRINVGGNMDKEVVPLWYSDMLEEVGLDMKVEEEVE